MTSNHETIATPDTDDQPAEGLGLPDITTTVDWHALPDPQLQYLSDMGSAINFDLTLVLPAGVITGIAIGAKEFYEGSADIVRAAIANANESTRTAGQLLIDAMITPEIEAIPEDDDPADQVHQGYNLISSIHLRDVALLTGPTVVRQKYLRVKLSDVTAWAYGRPLQKTD
ncbi:hypothetical protein ACFXG4_08240 [Nocardia sp. NPDC059246]|uniref:hypothetical protein n=1 Tax=unclassified Nocardia TaxID=2637762 RepID=UPI0036B17F6F